eukprot:TRINITY_DN65848_c0_g1_i1.p1 TRINITY_DN65848_c0_g1~~TRINITY_DN65848_c0_g1_i1.p1  ORF type:complete len:384 (+),score=85.42 TRINITY_DN65848_c0_g1_i1:47-1153(+)
MPQTHRHAAGRCLRRAPKSVYLLLAALGAVLSLSLGIQAPAALFARGAKSRRLAEFKGWELLVLKGKGKVPIAGLKLQKIPLKLVTLAIGGSTQSTLSKKDMLGFPFTTQNTGSLKIGFPRISGNLRLTLDDPTTGPSSDDVQGAAELSYEQQLKQNGAFSGKLRSSGEWGAAFHRDIEDLGHVRAGLDSQLDWNLDLDTSYPAIKGVAPSLTYGATQDGMRVKLNLESQLTKNLQGSYTVQNTPGQYSPIDFLHDVKLTMSSEKKEQKHAIEVAANYDRKFGKVPVRGSLTYRMQTKPASLETSVDFDRVSLQARTAKAQVRASMSHKADENGFRPAEVEVKVGKLAALAQLQPEKAQPRVRLSMDI